MSRRVLVACVGNVLRHDDGFGVAVARRLHAEPLPAGADVIETGIAGLAVVQQLMDGYDVLIVVDAVDLGGEPGSLFVLEPRVPEPEALRFDEWEPLLSNLHLAEPSRVFVLARALGVLPEQVLLVGCQPQTCDEFGESLSAPVEAAVEVAAVRVRELAERALESSKVTWDSENPNDFAKTQPGGGEHHERERCDTQA